MIYFEYNSVRYGIQFEYDYESGVDGGFHRSNTYCDIYQLMDDPDVDMFHVGYGAAILHVEDNFCAETGRKIAMGRALDDIKDAAKEFKQAAWNGYFNRVTARANLEMVDTEESC